MVSRENRELSPFPQISALLFRNDARLFAVLGGIVAFSVGFFVLLKNLTLEPVHPYTLRLVEHLWRSVMSAMNRLQQAPAARLVSTARATRRSHSLAPVGK